MGEELIIAALVFVIVCFLLVLFLFKQTTKLKAKVDALSVLIKESEKQKELTKRELQELRSGTIGMGRRLVELENTLLAQSDKLEEASQQDPQAKLYSRALKMVELGAGVEELVSECELPKAEAELIIRLHKK